MKLAAALLIACSLYRDGQSAGEARCVPAHGERAAPSLPQPATLQPGR